MGNHDDQKCFHQCTFGLHDTFMVYAGMDDEHNQIYSVFLHIFLSSPNFSGKHFGNGNRSKLCETGNMDCSSIIIGNGVVVSRQEKTGRTRRLRK